LSAHSRRKGYRFENDICNELRLCLGTIVEQPIKRVLDQYREGGLGDIVIPPFVIECKRYANKPEPPAEWWDQVWDAGKKSGLFPILIYKFDRRPIHCNVALYMLNDDFPRHKNYKADINWDTLMMVMREHLNG
tara:strand:- start:81 stop:482 length:402 start_codon:yes stop_codon:yes gene_type:complete